MAEEDFGQPIINEAIYNLQYKNAFTPQERTTIDNIKKLSELHKKFSIMPEGKGYEAYSKLDINIQNQLKGLYGEETNYTMAPQSFFGAAWNFTKDLATSPLRGLFRVAELYSQGLNSVQLAALQSYENGKDFFDVDTWSNALFEGESLYNQELDKQYTEKYGKARTFIAKQTLAGRRPGEIIDAYGTLDQEFIDALDSYFNEKEKWDTTILEDYRQAKLSVGRLVARNVLGGRNVRDGETYHTTLNLPIPIFNKLEMDADLRDKLFTQISGRGDFMYTVFADPLTYLTGGAGSGIKWAGIEISALAKANKAARMGDVSSLFKIKQVEKFWNGYGENIAKLKVATKNGDSVARSKIIKDIKVNFPRHGTDADIEFALRNNFVDAKKVEDYFSELQDLTFLVSGRTSDSRYFMNSVAIAQNQRLVGTAFRRGWQNLGKSKTKQDIVAVENELIQELSSLGKYDDAFLESTPLLRRFKEENRTWRNTWRNLLSRHPSDESIIVGDDAEKTIDTVRNIARILVPDDVAGVVAQRFLAGDTSERVVMLRGLYRGVMESMGIDKMPGGQNIIDEIMDAKFGRIGMTSTVNLKSAGIDAIDNSPIITNGAIYDFQATPIVGNLNWEELAQHAAAAALKTGGKSRGERAALLNLVGGVVNSKHTSWMLGKWNLFTLAPKLGIRGSIDEAFFAFMTAPSEVLWYLASGKAKSGAKAVTRYTASKNATGVFGSSLRKVFSKILPKSVGINPIEEISKAERHKIYQDAITAAQKLNLPREEAIIMAERLVAEKSLSYSHLLSAQESEYMIQMLTTGLRDIDSASSSLGRRLGTNASIEDEVRFVMSDETMLTKAQEELGASIGKGGRIYNVSELTKEEMKFAMFREFYKRFYKNELQGLNLGAAFVLSNGLKTSADVAKFKGIISSWILEPKVPTRLENFLSRRAGVYSLRKKGMSDAEIVDHYAEVISRDMYKAFHGEGFNDNLLQYFKSGWGNYDIDKIGQLTFEDYAKLVDNNVRTDNIVTDIENLTQMGDNVESFAARYSPDKMWEMMDRTQNALIRQPLVTSYYLHFRKQYKTIEEKYVAAEIEKASNANIPEEVIVRLAQKRFSEIAMRDAVSSTLKFVDNPHVRSNLATSIRNVNRFFRATEDFIRRVYRLKDAKIRTLYRLRLLHSGLNGVGFTHKDSEGNDYFILPMDNIIHGALDNTLRAFDPNGNGFQQPQFNNLTVQISALNPSFQDQAGIPFFSGPVAALSVLALKNIAGQFDGPVANVAEGADNFLLGDLGDNLDLRKAIVPAGIERLWRMLDADEKSRYNHTAILSAMAYNEAAGVDKIDANSTPEEIDAYLRNVRISGHNLTIIRSLLGTILPFSVGSQESVAPQFNEDGTTTTPVQIPDYILDTGITSIRSEYFDILDSIIKKHGADISDPYETAAAIFVGNNPNKLIYTVSREDKNIKPLLRRTDNVRNWIISNKSFIDKYGEAAYAFAPQMGDLNIAVYTWMEAAGLTDSVEIKKYLTDINVVIDKQKYFDIEDWENEQLSQTSDYMTRKGIINAASQWRESLKLANPLLKNSLVEGGFDVTWETNMLANIKSIIEDKEAPITKEQRSRMRLALGIFDKGYAYVTNDSLSALPNYSYLKNIMKDKILQDLNDISEGDTFLRQMTTMVFKPLLKYNARSVPSASGLNPDFSIGAM